MNKTARKTVKKAAKPAAAKSVKKSAKSKDGLAKPWTLRLYVAGQTPKSLTAVANLRRICEQHLPDTHEIEVVDLMANPQLAACDQILAIPTLVRKLPEPIRKIIGDLSSIERVLIALDIEKPLGVANAAQKGA